jgi:hypothetical protein
MEDLSKINVHLMEPQDEILPLVNQTQVMLFYIIAYHWKSTIS